ncbi:hypothetical protein LINPERHAP1_LOCUS11661 [Linum perenne]
MGLFSGLMVGWSREKLALLFMETESAINRRKKGYAAAPLAEANGRRPLTFFLVLFLLSPVFCTHCLFFGPCNS